MRGRSSDAALAARASGGDERAFEEIYDRYAPRLHSFCRRFLGSASDAEDALQATFVAAWRGLEDSKGEPPRSLQSWLFRIAHDKAVSLLRERERRPVPREEPAGDAVGEELAVASERRIELREVLSDVAALGERQRAVLLLLELGGLGQARVGEIVGEPVDRVREMARAARRSLSGAREARNADCAEIQRELSTIRRGRLRAPVHLHIRRCEPCRRYRAAVREQRKALGIALPVALPAGLKAGCLPSVAEAAEGSAAAAGGILTRLRRLRPDRLASAQGAAVAGATGLVVVAAGIAVASLGGGGGGPESPAIPAVDGGGGGGGTSAAASTGALDGGGPASRQGASRRGANGGAGARGGSGAGAASAGDDSGAGVAVPAIASGDPEPGTAPGDAEPQTPAGDPEPPPPPDPPQTSDDNPPRDPSDGTEINSEPYTGVGESPAGPSPPLDPPPSAPTDPPGAPPTPPPEPDPEPPEPDPEPPEQPPEDCLELPLLDLCIDL